MNTSTMGMVVRFLHVKPWAAVVAVAVALLLVIFLMQCAWTIRHGGSLTILDDVLHVTVPAGPEAPIGSQSAEERREPP